LYKKRVAQKKKKIDAIRGTKAGANPLSAADQPKTAQKGIARGGTFHYILRAENETVSLVNYSN